jgi:hypothetical protein
MEIPQLEICIFNTSQQPVEIPINFLSFNEIPEQTFSKIQKQNEKSIPLTTSNILKRLGQIKHHFAKNLGRGEIE